MVVLLAEITRNYRMSKFICSLKALINQRVEMVAMAEKKSKFPLYLGTAVLVWKFTRLKTVIIKIRTHSHLTTKLLAISTPQSDHRMQSFLTTWSIKLLILWTDILMYIESLHRKLRMFYLWKRINHTLTRAVLSMLEQGQRLVYRLMVSTQGCQLGLL